MHQSAFECLGALIGRHFGDSLVPMAESDLIEDLIIRFAIDEHL
jgi:hypothetical protein